MTVSVWSGCLTVTRVMYENRGWRFVGYVRDGNAFRLTFERNER